MASCHVPINWPRPTAIAMLENTFERKIKSTKTRRYYLSSLPADAILVANATRNHWHVENRLHWAMDVVFHDDLCCLRTRYGPHNMALAKQIALNPINAAKGKLSIKIARKTAGWSENFLSMAIARKVPTT